MIKFEMGAAESADSAARIISGVVVPWDRVGRTSIGEVSISPGAVRVPAELSRVKLLGGGHDWETPVGYAVSAENTDVGLVMAFKIASTPAGDMALLEASAKVRDAFSVELDNVESRNGVVTGAELVAVAQLAVPAFADARVVSVAAQRNRGGTMSEHETETETETEHETERESAPEVEREVEHETETERETRRERPTSAAARPVGLSAGSAPQARPSGRRMPTLYAALASRATDGDLSPEMTAALYDVTHTANSWVQPTQWENELWAGVGYARRIVPLLTNRDLTSYKITGWRWKTKPQVDEYAGDKAEVPTNPAVTESVDTTAARLAGAHDIDRKFRDFGDTAFFQAYYEAMAESWAIKTDTIAATFLTANATAAGNAADVLMAVDIGAETVEDNTNVAASFALVNPTDWRTLMGVTSETKPAFLDLLPFPPSRLIRTKLVGAGTVIVGAKQAVSWYERAGSPIRVETVDLAHGGIDGGVFGYYATLLNNAGGLVKVTIGSGRSRS